MDRSAVRILNVLLGNPESFAAIEMHFPGSEVMCESDCFLAFGGSEVSAELDGQAAAGWRVHKAAAGQTIRFRRGPLGNRAYLAAAGGLMPSIGLPPDGHSAFDTLRLRNGDRLAIGAQQALPASAHQFVSPFILPRYAASPAIRVIAGPEFEQLSGADKVKFETGEFTISNDSDRMGFRLRGAAIDGSQIEELVSAAVTFGTVQLTPDGQMIVLMAEHQTSGGYPRIASVITADLPLVSQLGPGDKLRFRLAPLDEAERAMSHFEEDLRRLKVGVTLSNFR